MTTNTTALETLVDTMTDSVRGYEQSAEAANSPELKRILTEQAQKRQRSLDTLSAEMRRLGGELATRGTVAGKLHHMWIDVTAMFRDGDKAAVARVEEGEDYLASKFEAALESTDLDPQTRAAIQQVYAEVKEGERIGDMLEQQFG